MESTDGRYSNELQWLNSKITHQGNDCRVTCAIVQFTDMTSHEMVEGLEQATHWGHELTQQNGRHFADDISRYIFLNEKFYILIRFSLKFVAKGTIDNKWALVQVMDWRLFGAKPLPEPMLIQFTDAYMRQ